MNRPKLFRLEFKDPVVEYYFIPGRSDIRLTVRFGQVFVHREVYDAAMKNFVWCQEGPVFKSLVEAEKCAIDLMSNSITISYPQQAKTRSFVSEHLAVYRAA